MQPSEKHSVPSVLKTSKTFEFIRNAEQSEVESIPTGYENGSDLNSAHLVSDEAWARAHRNIMGKLSTSTIEMS